MLTKTEEKTIQFITRYITSHGHAPTLEEIGEGIGVHSRGTVHRYVKALEDKGHIERESNWRGIRLAGEGMRKMNFLPLLGRISAGKPIEAIARQDAIDLPKLLVADDRFVLKVAGDSMIDAGIHEDDYVVVQRQHHAQRGDIVVALVDQQEATVKRYFPTKKHIKLVPENQAMQVQLYAHERVTIQGIVIAKVGFFQNL